MSLLNVPIGPNAPGVFNTIIEIPKGSTNKYEFDTELGTFRLDRVLFSPLFYPFDYGFIPQTHYVDGDPIDVLVLVSHPSARTRISPDVSRVRSRSESHWRSENERRKGLG